ncbi:DUF4332 domain-containing protein [Arcticibacterium luteifluviistationis]|uniref:DUF4332 domain-containing protein n=1 Tax=Arcticibacterium luteifluviistationis TaxID=1784714 RepID=A0A2Z4G7Y9_9BACT|nr:DUF4332 domain-containing protein [Arcticibacterium luteifluviistationis]AWV97173.1 hypothetical protein DJ013_02875 [Arcticibacterium luteifluviistationis]
MSKKQLAKDALKSFLKTVKKIKSFDLKKTFTEDGKTYSMLSLIVKHKKGDVPEPKLETKPKKEKKDDKGSKKSAKKKDKSKGKKKTKYEKTKLVTPKPLAVKVTITKTPEIKPSPVAKPLVVKATAKPAASKAVTPAVKTPAIPAASKAATPAVKAPAKPAASKAVTPAVKSATTRSRKPTVGDNLKLIEGIGPKIESFLKEDGIDTFEKLSKANPEEIQKMLVAKGGTRYNANNPTTWPEQAALAAKGDMEAFKALKLELKGGKRA